MGEATYTSEHPITCHMESYIEQCMGRTVGYTRPHVPAFDLPGKSENESAIQRLSEVDHVGGLAEFDNFLLL